MKTKLIGLGILAAVIIAAAAYVFISNSQTVTEINGYVGGEKIGLLEDEEVQDILRDRYRLVIDYAKAGRRGHPDHDGKPDSLAQQQRRPRLGHHTLRQVRIHPELVGRALRIRRSVRRRCGRTLERRGHH